MTLRFNSKRWHYYVRFAVYGLVPMVLLLLPSDYFDEGESKCLSVVLFDRECYGCGTTRSIMHLIHFDFVNAIYYNPLGLVVFPLLALVWAQSFMKDYKNFRLKFGRKVHQTQN